MIAHVSESIRHGDARLVLSTSSFPCPSPSPSSTWQCLSVRYASSPESVTRFRKIMAVDKNESPWHRRRRSSQQRAPTFDALNNGTGTGVADD